MSVLAEAMDVRSGTEMVKLDLLNNWTGREELPFELAAERVLEMESEGQVGALTVTFGKPTLIEGMGWACVFKMSAMGREHVSPARGVDSLHALQMAVEMVGKQLKGMGRSHRITLHGGDDLGFLPAGVMAGAPAAQCPVRGMGLGV